MAASNVVGDEEQSKESDLNQGKYKCCVTKECPVKVCVNCCSIYHKSCAERISNIKIIDGNKVICCEKNALQISVNKHRSTSKEENFELEIKYLKKLLGEMEEKNNILKENNSLLKEKIQYLNKTSENINLQDKNSNINQSEVKTTAKKYAQTKTPYEQVTSKQSSQETNFKTSKANQIQKDNLGIPQDKQIEIMHEIINLEPSTSNNQPEPNNHCKIQSDMKLPELGSPRNNLSTYPYRQAMLYGKTQNNNQANNKTHGENRPRTKRREINIGTANIQDAEKDFIGKEVNKNVWLFTSSVKDHVTEEKIKKYIIDETNTQDDKEVVVEHIKTKYDDTRKDCKCFKVGINFEFKEKVYEHNFWPNKVAYRRFDFEAKTRLGDEKDF